MDNNVRFKFIKEELKKFYGDKIFDGAIVRKGNKDYIESLCEATSEDICKFGYDYFELNEVEITAWKNRFITTESCWQYGLYRL